MKKALIALLVTCASVATPSSAQAWGFAGHRLIMERAIALLPPELQPFFDRFKSELIVRVTDPDTWRNVGWDDDANHFLDFGVEEYGDYPFTALPREHGAALEKFGAVTLKRNGLLPWREAELFGNLRRAFATFTKDAPYATSDVVLFAAVASHYLQDAHQPLHATDNYDGQKTGQSGLHSRFERDLIERYADRLQLQPPAPAAIASIRDYSFDTLLSSYKETDRILRADKAAIAGKDAYDTAYFEAFFAEVHPVLQERLSQSITATASMIISAWQQAGRPTPRLQDARPVQRVRGAR